MAHMTDKKTAPDAAGDDSVRMYPSNQLKEQVRDPKEAFSAFSVLKDTFFTAQ
jgi:hypothetical protein